MNPFLHALTCVALLVPFTAQDPAARPATDEERVRQVALDYVEALYEVKPERIERSVHPNLVKYGFWRKDEATPYKGMAMTKAQLVELAKKWNAKGDQADAGSVKKVEILDLMDQTAVVKVTAVWGVDHMQLAVIDGTWQILHILWQSHPAKQDPAAKPERPAKQAH
jgi:hypothetical protein